MWLAGCTESKTLEPKGVVVTLGVAAVEEYRMRLTDPADIAIARQLLAGEAVPGISTGVVVHCP
jgi:hypothetical protein